MPDFFGDSGMRHSAVGTAGTAPALDSVQMCVVGIGLAIVTAVWIWAAHLAESDKQNTIRQASAANANLARVFEEHASQTFRAADKLLLQMTQGFERQGEQFELARLFKEWQVDRKYVVNAVISNTAGKVVSSSDEGALPTVNLADREHVKVHAARDTGTMFISKPVLARVNGQWSVILTRRASAPDGSYLGVAGLAIDPGYFTRLFGSLALDANDSISLAGIDGVIRARRVGAKQLFGESISGGTLLDRVRVAPEGTYFTTAKTDCVRRMYTYRKVAGFPLVVNIGISEEHMFAGFKKRQQSYFENALAATFIVLLAIMALLRLLQRERKIQNRLSGSEARYRELVHMAPIAVFVSQGITLAYANQTGLNLLGARSPDDIIGDVPNAVEG